MPILEICSMMLLLDCSNPIVVHSMALKHGALIHQIINALKFCISWNKSVRNILRSPYTTHTSYLDSWAIVGQPHIHCQLQQRTLRFLCSILNNNNTLVSACWKYASNNANSPLGYDIVYFRNS